MWSDSVERSAHAPSDTPPRHTVGQWLSAAVAGERVGRALNYNCVVRHGITTWGPTPEGRSKTMSNIAGLLPTEHGDSTPLHYQGVHHQKDRMQISAVLLMVVCHWGQVGGQFIHFMFGSRGSKPHEFRTGQVGQESNRRPAVVEFAALHSVAF